MSDFKLLIVMRDRGWTMAALHLACALSRRDHTDIFLLKLVPVRHPMRLGTPEGSLDFSGRDAADLAEMEATSEDYGVYLNVYVCQYANYWRAISDAAAQIGVSAVMIHNPPNAIFSWSRIQARLLRRRLARQKQLLFTLDELSPSLTWVPSLTLEDEHPLEV